ncbi:hypothetical protein LTR53_020433, partial [Teratosphaeriaceae sp. CCFEE 6253]
RGLYLRGRVEATQGRPGGQLRARHRLLPRRPEQDLRAAPAEGARRAGQRAAGAEGVLLRLRRREQHGAR